MALNGNSINSHNSGSGTTPKSLFPRGPSFTVENFSNKDFIVRDFVEELAESAIPVNRRSGPANQAFDPKPLIRHFESRRPLKEVPWNILTWYRCPFTACIALGGAWGHRDGTAN